jgi:hypothetical protein
MVDNDNEGGAPLGRVSAPHHENKNTTILAPQLHAVNCFPEPIGLLLNDLPYGLGWREGA